MTQQDRIRRIPTDRHVHYSRETRSSWWTPRWMARWKDDNGKRRAVSLGIRLPADRPDFPCQHVGQLFHWRAPTTEAERLAYQEQGRRGNAARVIHSNQHLKHKHGSWDREEAS
jgi:hypothetical protein